MCGTRCRERAGFLRHARQVLLHMQHSAEAKALYSWREYAARRANLRQLLEVASGRVSGSRLAACFRAWHQVGCCGCCTPFACLPWLLQQGRLIPRPCG